MERLIEMQKKIESLVLGSLRGCPKPRRVVGLDAAYSRKYGGVGIAALTTYDDSRLIDYAVALGEPELPYIPGLLAFREAPLLYTALQRLEEKGYNYDVVIVDGHGVSHPRHTGIASHIGLALGKPSIGVAKRRLYGIQVLALSPYCKPREPCIIGALYEKYGAPRLLAYIVRTATGSRIYVSPGANIAPRCALAITLHLLKCRPLPAPTYFADKLSKKIARSLDSGTLTPQQLKGSGLDRYITQSKRA